MFLWLEKNVHNLKSSRSQAIKIRGELLSNTEEEGSSFLQSNGQCVSNSMASRCLG
jgi:lipopolysaccharide export system protein LptA